jgi:murein L,D-transpeptidase YafK
MKRRTFGWGILATLLAGGCASKFHTYNGPEVTSVVVNKGDRRVYLMHDAQILRSYDMELGRVPEGDKKMYGDGKTPEGLYRIDRRNPNSAFHLSIGISYPNAADRAEAAALGEKPGGDIFIHGQPNNGRATGRDWTEGCIAVKDKASEEIFAMVRIGTPIAIRP